MNLQEIAKKYPKGWEKFSEYVRTKIEAQTIQEAEEFLEYDDEYGVDGELAKFYRDTVKNKMAEEFFDEQGMYLGIHPYGRGKIYFAYTITQSIFNDEQGKVQFISRQQAFDSGIEKCFEICESQLGDSK